MISVQIILCHEKNSLLPTVAFASTFLVLKHSQTKSMYTTNEYQANTKHLHSK